MTEHRATSEPPPTAWRARLPAILVCAAAVGYVCLAAYFSLRRHDEFRSGIDLANFDQALWLMSNFDEPFVTQHGRSFWGDHLGLTPALLAPLYLVGAGAGTLLVVQAIAMAAVAPLLYALARAYGASGWLASIPAVLWLASPLTLVPSVVDVHHIPLVAPAIVGSILALKHDRLVVFAVLALLACGAKEDVPLVYVMVGAVVALEGRRRLGAMISGAAAAVFAVAFFVFIPAFSDSLDWFARRFGGDRGVTLGDVVVWMLTHPLATLQDVLTVEHLLILGALVGTTGGLCLLGARWLLVGVPALAQNFLSAYAPQHGLRDHYYVPVAIAFSVAAAAGVGRLRTSARPVRLVAAAGVAVALVAFPLGVRYVDLLSRWSPENLAVSGGAPARRDAASLVPDGAVVAASPRFTPHLSHRTEIYALPLPFFGREELGSDWSAAEMRWRAAGVEWVVLDVLERPNEVPDAPERLVPLLSPLGFEEVERRATVLVYRRASRS